MPHSKILSQVFQVGFWCGKKQVWSTHLVDWENDLKNEDDLKDDLKNEDALKNEDDLKNEDTLKNEDDLFALFDQKWKKIRMDFERKWKDCLIKAIKKTYLTYSQLDLCELHLSRLHPLPTWPALALVESALLVKTVLLVYSTF